MSKKTRSRVHLVAEAMALLMGLAFLWFAGATGEGVVSLLTGVVALAIISACMFGLAKVIEWLE